MPRPNRGAYLTFHKPRGVYYIQWYENGRPRKRSTGTADVREAEAILAAFIGQRQADQRTGPRDPSDVFVTEALALYASEHAPHTKAPDRIAYTIAALIPFWQTLTIGDVTKEACRAYMRDRQRSAGTIRRELTTLRAAINYAHSEGRITRQVPVWLPPKPAGQDRWLTRDEAAALLNAARNRRADVRLYLPLFIILALYTGARKEAILSLRWTQVDFANKRINFGKRVDADGNPVAETNKRRAHIPIPNALMTFLKQAYKRRASDIGFVVHDKGKPIKDIGDSRNGSFGRACEDAKLTGVKPHTLRHTCGTWLAQKGVPLFLIGGWLGHSDARTTALYAHHHPDFQGEALAAMNKRK